MTVDRDRSRRRLRRQLLALGCLVVLLGGAVAIAVLRRQPRGPAVLNEPTIAREVRPLTTQPDPRFDPLPFEREKHGR